MKKQLILILMTLLPMLAWADESGTCGDNLTWTYYEYTQSLVITGSGDMYDYSQKQDGVVWVSTAPWNKYCDEIGSVILPEGLTSIGDYVFYECSSLTSMTIPNSVTSIGGAAFYKCSGLKKVIVKDIAAWCGIKFDDVDSNPLYYAKHIYSDEDTEITNLIIPNSVTSIGYCAFYGCSSLTSITIPNSVTSIGGAAFYGCSGLTSVTIPNSVTSIGGAAFAGCFGLTSITIPNSVTSIEYGAFSYCSGLTSVTIPNSVTSIGDYAFEYCSGLTSITIPNSVTSIGGYAFSHCSGLTSITIPNSVTSIGNSAFSGCSGLTSVTIGSGVTSIGAGAFFYCSSLTSITIPNSVTTIGEGAFQGCSSLASVTIPNSVTSIGDYAFKGADISTVISLIENPFKITGKISNYRTFSQNTFNNATLYVPKGTIDKYKATDGWKDFLFIEEGTGGGDTPTTQKCEKPTISYENGKLTFSSATDGAVCQYSITDTDIKAGSGNEVQLGVTYTISVYATKSGYDNSETATATLCWIDKEPVIDVTGISQVPAQAVLIQSEGGVLNVQGLDDGQQVRVYDIDGKQAGAAVSSNGQAVVGTNLKPGSVAIIKIGDRGVKVVIK